MTLRSQLLGMLELDDYLDDHAIPDERTPMTAAGKRVANADLIVSAARAAIEEGTRPLAVQVTSGVARQITAASAAGTSDAEELMHAWQLIAELAVRLAERDSR